MLFRDESNESMHLMLAMTGVRSSTASPGSVTFRVFPPCQLKPPKHGGWGPHG